MKVKEIVNRLRVALPGSLLVVASCASAVSLPPHENTAVLQPASENAAYTSQILTVEEAAAKPAEPSRHEHNHGEHAYVCPMHPEVQSDKPGRCHKCGMQLKKREVPNARP